MDDSAVILIIPSASYRTSAFINAVENLDLKVLVISDKSQVFSGKYPDNLMIMNFHHWKDRLDEISEWSERNGLKGVIGVDEESIVLAANISKYLKVEHNPVESVLLTKDKYLSISFWRDENALNQWREHLGHREAQKKWLNKIFRNYRIRVAEVIRDYGKDDRNEAP